MPDSKEEQNNSCVGCGITGGACFVGFGANSVSTLDQLCWTSLIRITRDAAVGGRGRLLNMSLVAVKRTGQIPCHYSLFLFNFLGNLLTEKIERFQFKFSKIPNIEIFTYFSFLKAEATKGMPSSSKQQRHTDQNVWALNGSCAVK